MSLTPYLIGWTAWPGGGAGTLLSITTGVAVPAGDAIYVICGRAIDQPVFDPTINFQPVSDNSGNVYQGVAGYSPGQRISYDTVYVFDMNRQFTVNAILIPVGGFIDLTTLLFTSALQNGALVVALGIPGPLFIKANTVIGGSTGVAGGTVSICTFPEPEGVYNTAIAWAVSYSGGPTPGIDPPVALVNSPADDGWDFLTHQQYNNLSTMTDWLAIDIYTKTFPPGPAAGTLYRWASNVLGMTAADMFVSAAPLPLIINGFPQLAPQSVACRRSYCPLPWLG